jgi:hypothetical protein
MMTLKEYLNPNTAVREPVLSPEWWTPPAPSLGLRHFTFASKASSRGVLIADNRCIEFESRLERNVTLVFLARPDTLRVIEQSPRVEWVDENGGVREHIFDLQVDRRDGVRIAADVKPSAKVSSSGIRRLHSAIAVQMSPKVAGQLLVITEKKLSRADLYNAELIHSVFRNHFPDDDKVILALIRKMKGPAPISDLVAQSGLQGYGFNAVVRAIAAGHLSLEQQTMIVHGAFVVPRSQRD